MEKRRHIQRQLLKKVASFRVQQRRVSEMGDEEQFRSQQHHELQQILSPFWAWRSRSS